MGTIGKLERYEGHLLNWYDVKTLTPLEPRYVSSVDSGNLLVPYGHWSMDGQANSETRPGWESFLKACGIPGKS